MKRIFVFLDDYQGSGYYRLDQPVIRCRYKLLEEGIELVIGRTFDGDQPWDAVMLHLVPFPAFMPMVKVLKQRGTKIVWNLDDFMPACPTWNEARRIVDQDFKERWVQLAELADLIVASTDTLAQQFGSKAIVLPNLINFDYIPQVKRKETPITILWAGSPTHSDDLGVMGSIIPRMKELYGSKVRFLFFGQMCEPDLSQYKPCVEFRYYFEEMAKIEACIGIAPLVYNRFNACKSNLKWLEYSAFGMATVAQAFDPYDCISHGRTGMLCYDKDEWFGALCDLVEDPELRQAMASNALEEVKEHWSWQSEECLEQWLTLFRGLVA